MKDRFGDQVGHECVGGPEESRIRTSRTSSPPFRCAIVRIAISVDAFEAIARTLPLGSFGFEREPNAKGERTAWLDEVWVDRLGAMRGPNESYSDVILRIAGRDDRKEPRA